MRSLPIAALLAALLIPTAPALAAPPAVLATADGTQLAGRFSLLGQPLGALAGGGGAVATDDVNGDGTADRVFGGQSVVVRDGKTGAVLYMWHAARSGRVNVAVGDLDGDRRAEIVTAPAIGLGAVNVYRGTTVVRSFDPGFIGGVSVATGDVNGDGFDDIITGAGPGAGPHVKVFDGRTNAVVGSFFAFDPGFRGGVHVAAGDANGNGGDDILVAIATGGPPHVKVFGKDANLLRSFFAGDPTAKTGARVAAGGGAIAVASGGTIRVLDARSLATRASFVPFGGIAVGGLAL